MNIFQEVVKFINSFQQGETFTTLQFHNHMAKLGYRDSYQPHYRINTYRTYLRSAGFLTNVSQGVWRVNYRIPTWLSLSALETARNYKGNAAQRRDIRAKIEAYKQACTQPTWAFKIGDTIQVGTDETVYTIEQHPTNANDVYVTWVDKDGKQSITYDKSYIHTLLTKKNPHWKLVTPKPVEAPKPAETKKPRLMLCVDMSDSPADYTVGKVYELSNEDDDYYYFKRNDQGVGGGGMFKRRFKEIKDEVANSVKVLCTNNSGGYEDLLTVGKIYEAVPSKDGEKCWTIPVSDDGAETGAYKHRFTVVTEETTSPKQETPKKKVVYCIDNKMSYATGELTIGKEYEVVQEDKKEGTITVVNDKGLKDYYRSTRFSDTNPKRTWKVGDKILSSFLNDSNIEKEFHGYDAGWNIYTERVFMHDRKVEVIQEREGKRAARISGTMDIWITLESLELHP